MNRVVLDASALLAILNQEPGAEKLTPELLSAAAISTVNLVEVHGKLVGRGLRPDDAWEAALSPIREAIPFTSEHARLVGDLVAQTRPLGHVRLPLLIPGQKHRRHRNSHNRGG